jgi:hypothetical protein
MGNGNQVQSLTEGKVNPAQSLIPLREKKSEIVFLRRLHISFFESLIATSTMTQ